MVIAKIFFIFCFVLDMKTILGKLLNKKSGHRGPVFTGQITAV